MAQELPPTVQELSEQYQHADRRLLTETVCRAERFVRVVQYTQRNGKSRNRTYQRPLVFRRPPIQYQFDGYIDRASVGLNSYYLQGGYYSDNTSIKLITFGGKERTYHAWNYASKEEMEKYGRRYNSSGIWYTDDNGTDHFYEDQTDNYVQKNYQLLFNHNFTSAWNVNVGLHYTKGDGYYQEYKGGRKLVEYGLLPYEHDGENRKQK